MTWDFASFFTNSKYRASRSSSKCGVGVSPPPSKFYLAPLARGFKRGIVLFLFVFKDEASNHQKQLYYLLLTTRYLLLQLRRSLVIRHWSSVQKDKGLMTKDKEARRLSSEHKNKLFFFLFVVSRFVFKKILR